MDTQELISHETNTRSSVKLLKNSKNVNWEIRVVFGEEGFIDGLKVKALQIHRELEQEFNQDGA
jgi:hypothetical protein